MCLRTWYCSSDSADLLDASFTKVSSLWLSKNCDVENEHPTPHAYVNPETDVVLLTSTRSPNDPAAFSYSFIFTGLCLVNLPSFCISQSKLTFFEHFFHNGSVNRLNDLFPVLYKHSWSCFLPASSIFCFYRIGSVA